MRPHPARVLVPGHFAPGMKEHLRVGRHVVRQHTPHVHQPLDRQSGLRGLVLEALVAFHAVAESRACLSSRGARHQGGFPHFDDIVMAVSTAKMHCMYQAELRLGVYFAHPLMEADDVVGEDVVLGQDTPSQTLPARIDIGA